MYSDGTEPPMVCLIFCRFRSEIVAVKMKYFGLIDWQLNLDFQEKKIRKPLLEISMEILK